ncbi:MAG TPA: sel1 repeat family protein [Rhodospirillaceae bacterium]|nr:sel1 repeat family protein [Rhodospirillaceae bacterium]
MIVQRHFLLSLVLLGLAQGASVLAETDEGVSALQRGDYSKAMEIWAPAAEAGQAAAQYSLGYLYQFGLGVSADLGKAKEWYEKAALANNADALYALGLMYETGKSGRKDLNEALRLYRKAAASGQQADAEYAVGRMILRGRGVARDPEEAIKWLKKAAEHNQSAAQYMLGAACEAGWGLPADPLAAYYWYRRSQNGDAVELQEHDMAFQPQIAIDALKRRLSADDIRGIEARIKKDEHAVKTPEAAAAKTLPRAMDLPVEAGEALTR